MERYEAEDRIYYTRNGTPRIKQYLDEMPGMPLQDMWTDIYPVNSQAVERVDYATQKPEALLERIILTSSDEGKTVADYKLLGLHGIIGSMKVSEYISRSLRPLSNSGARRYECSMT